MSRMTLVAACAVILPSIAFGSDDLIPVPDPISTPTALAQPVPCEEEADALSDAIIAAGLAGQALADAIADADQAEADLDDCLAMGGDCSAEQAALDIALILLQEADNDALETAAAAVAAQTAYDNCMNGGGPGPGPEPDPEPDPPVPPLYAVISWVGYGAILQLIS